MVDEVVYHVEGLVQNYRTSSSITMDKQYVCINSLETGEFLSPALGDTFSRLLSSTA